MVVRVILDTNFLMIPDKFSVDIISGLDDLFGATCYELYILKAVESELKILEEKLKGGEKRLARFARTYLSHLKKAKGLKTISSNNEVYLDDALVSLLTHDNNYYVATIDKELQVKIKELGAQVICVRQGKYLMIK